MEIVFLIILQSEERESKQQSPCIRHTQGWNLSANYPYRLRGLSSSLLRQVKTLQVKPTFRHLTTFLFSVHLEMKSTKPNGYLSITDYPLLPFYAVMCGVYVLLGKKKYLKNILFIINNIRAGVVTSLLSLLERDP